MTTFGDALKKNEQSCQYNFPRCGAVTSNHMWQPVRSPQASIGPQQQSERIQVQKTPQGLVDAHHLKLPERYSGLVGIGGELLLVVVVGVGDLGNLDRIKYSPTTSNETKVKGIKMRGSFFGTQTLNGGYKTPIRRR